MENLIAVIIICTAFLCAILLLQPNYKKKYENEKKLRKLIEDTNKLMLENNSTMSEMLGFGERTRKKLLDEEIENLIKGEKE